MYINRYSSDSLVNGKILGTNSALPRIRDAIAGGSIATSVVIAVEGDRLDTLAGKAYGDGRLWWVIAAASNVGWWLQIPPGTRLLVPTDLSQVMGMI